MGRSLVVEADGGSRGNPGPAAYGTVVRDAATGAVLAELAEYLGDTTNNVAEYRGAIAGLERAREIDPGAVVEVRLDSKLVVEQMSGRWKIKNENMRELALRLRAVLPPGQVSYTWVPRERNKAADRLVNEMLDGIRSSGSPLIDRTPGDPAQDVLPPATDDVVGSIDLGLEIVEAEQSVAVTPPRVMIGWADIGVPTVTVLARHGATLMSVEKRFSGRGGFDAPLSDLGERQAEALAREVAAHVEVNRIVSSPLLRTRQTAQRVADVVGLPVEVDDDLAECDFGMWDGSTFAEVRDRWPAELAAWLGSVEVAPPGGESFAACRSRVLRARSRLVERFPGERVLVVAHVTPIKVLVAEAVGAPLEALYRMELKPCSLSTLAWFPDGNTSMFSFAESSHLRDVAAPDGT